MGWLRLFLPSLVVIKRKELLARRERERERERESVCVCVFVDLYYFIG